MPDTWYGNDCCIGLHYDLHALEQDTELGTKIDDTLGDLLHKLGIDFVQTDSKGHPGYLSWFSKLPVSSIPSGLTHDALAGWREQTRRFHLPLHCHYSGIWDKAASKRFPDWQIQQCPEGAAVCDKGQNSGTDNISEIMCPNRGYPDELLLPQMFEMVERYGVDGFWVDGDIWAVRPCYCDCCRERYILETGKTEMPTQEDDPDWPLLWNFVRRSFNRYVTHYCNKLHQRYPNIKVCSNWLQTYRNPGKPEVPTDWISGDNPYRFGLDTLRCEARFLETRGKPWDIMIWTFFCNVGFDKPESPWTFKPIEMLEQEVALILSHGGNIQLYETAAGLRDGRLVPWRIRRLKQVVDFIRLRLPLCKKSVSVPQACVLHSENHFYRHVKGTNLLYGGDIAPVNGAVYMLLENHYHTDLCDEWALMNQLDEYPLVIVPEQDDLSEEMVEHLKKYVRQGGTLVLTGAGLFDRFGEDFIGARSFYVENKKCYYVPDGDDGVAPLYSEQFRLLRPTTAFSLLPLFKLWEVGDDKTDFPAAVMNRVETGKVIYIPAAIARDYSLNRMPPIRAFFEQVLRKAAVKLAFSLDGPSWVEAALRRCDEQLQIHLINRATGVPNLPDQASIAEIPATGELHFNLKMDHCPRKVHGAWEHPAELEWKWENGILSGTLPHLYLYEVILVD